MFLSWVLLAQLLIPVKPPPAPAPSTS